MQCAPERSDVRSVSPRMLISEEGRLYLVACCWHCCTAGHGAVFTWHCYTAGHGAEAQPPAEDVYQPLLHGTSEDSRLEDLQFENYDKPLVGAGTEAAAAEQRRAQAQIKPSLGYLTHPRWSDEGSGPSVVGGSLAANSPGSRTHPGTPTAARQIAEHNKQLCTALHNHLSLRTP
eukprot:scaffold86263_cov18-Tisochrysis_lutea.AAC.1